MTSLRRAPLSALCTVVVVVAAASLAAEDQPAEQPQPAAPAAEGTHNLEVTVTAVEGLVQVRTAEDQPWQKPEVGQKLGPGAEFRTGPKSFVEFSIGEGHKVRLDRLGTVKVINALVDQGKVKTDLGMKYGQTRYNVEAAGQETDAKIHSPGATLAIRGTYVSLYNRPPFDTLGISYWDGAFFDVHGNKIPFGGEKYAEILSKLESAAETAKDKTSQNPQGNFSGETLSEEELRELYQALAGFEQQYFLNMLNVDAIERFLQDRLQRLRDQGDDDDDVG